LAALFLVPSSADSFAREDVGGMFLRNVGWLSTDYKVLYPKEVNLHNHRCENLKPYTALRSHDMWKNHRWFIWLKLCHLIHSRFGSWWRQCFWTCNKWGKLKFCVVYNSINKIQGL
jgi:hypothetical protein